MKSKKIRWIVVISIVLITVLIIIAKNSEGDETKVSVEKAALHTITETVTASGKIYPETEVKIAPEVSGEITLLAVQEGDSVKQGDMLVKINPAIYNSVVNQAEATVEQTRASAINTKEMMAQDKFSCGESLPGRNGPSRVSKSRALD